MKPALRFLKPSLCVTLLAALTTISAAAQTVPALINYQGRLVNSNNIPLPTGDYELRFSIWDAATGGTQVWGAQVFNGQTGPGFGPKVPVVQGWFNLVLGPVDTNSATIADAFTGTNRFVQIQEGTCSPLSPRQQVLSAPYAMVSANADNATRLGSLTWSNFFGTADPAFAKVNRASLADQASNASSVGGIAFLQLGLVPVGSILAWAKNLPGMPPLPTTFAECNGQKVQDAQSLLNGVTLPNLNQESRFLRGNLASGATGGAESVTIGASQMPAHVHPQSIATDYVAPWVIPSEAHDLGAALWGTTAALSCGDGCAVVTVPMINGTAGTAVLTGSSGQGQPVDNRPPYYDVIWIMRIK